MRKACGGNICVLACSFAAGKTWLPAEIVKVSFNMDSYVDLRKWELFRNTDVQILSRIKLCHVFGESSTKLSAIFIDVSDNAFAIGYNDKYNKLGIGNFTGDVKHPKPIPTLSQENITSILTGAAMSQSGDVFFWGRDLSDWGSHPKTIVPQKINAGDFMRGERASQLACSWNALGVITTTGKLLVWGRWGGLVLKEEVRMSVEPKSIVGGGCHFAVVTDGGLYTFGSGSSGQLGYEWDSEKDGYVTPKRVKFEEPVYSVACSGSATLVCLHSGSLYVFGDNGRGRLGVESTEKFIHVPTKINLAEPIKYVLASVYNDLFYAVTARNKVYRWGADGFKPEAVQVSTIIEAFANRAIPVSNKTPNADSAPPLVALPDFNAPQLGNFNDDGKFSDVIIKLKDGDFKAHRIILHSRSDHFKRLLNDNWVEGQSRVVDMTDYDPKAYRAYLFYIYNGVVDRLEPLTVIHLYTLADQYLDVKLKDHCFNHFKSILNIENVGELYHEAEQHSCFDLLNECYTFATRNINKLEEHMKSVNFEAYMKILLTSSSLFRG